MTLQMFSGILIVLAIMIVPCIPVLWLMYCFLRDLIKIIREVVTDAKEEMANGSEARVGFVAEYLQEQLEKQDEIREKGAAGYYIGKAKEFWKEYSFLFYAVGMILLLTLLMFREVIAIAAMAVSRFPVATVILALFAIAEILVLIYYVICRNHRGKWKSAVALLVLVGLKQIAAALLNGSFYLNIDSLLYGMLFLAVHHYEQWKRELTENTRILQQRLMENCYADDTIVQMYLALQEHRRAIGERDTVFRKLRNDDELDEMRQYLNWLEQLEEEAE